MVIAQQRHGRTRLGYAWWRPAAYSVAAAAAVAALFNPLPALADPAAGQPVLPGSVPDAGSRPIPAGAVVLPGQSSVTATTPITTSRLAGSTNPILQKIQKGRDQIAALGDQLIQLGQDRDSRKAQQDAASQQYTVAQNDLRTAQSAAADAAEQDVIEAAGMPPGAVDSGLLGLDDLAHLQRGQGGSTAAAARQLEQAQLAARTTLDKQTLAQTQYADALAKYEKLNGQIAKLQAAQQKLENDNRDLLNAAEAAENATNSQLGAQYLTGSEAGRGADPRALQAVQFALSQRGKPYVWSTEGPYSYDCSGLVYAAYHSVGFNIVRVARDQYWQTRDKVVDRYSLLPGDLLFFSYSNSWRDIHHVAMYAGNGMMVEAPRTGLNVRLVPVRWTELFQATRVFGSVPGGSTGPALGSPDPQPAETAPAHGGGSHPSHSTSPSSSHPATTPPATKPPTTPPATTPPTTTPPTTTPTTAPATTPASTPRSTAEAQVSPAEQSPPTTQKNEAATTSGDTSKSAATSKSTTAGTK